MFLSRTAHVLLSSRIPLLSFFSLRFFPYVLNITPEGIYTFKFSLFPSYHLIGLQYKYLGKKAKILVVNF